MSVKDNLVDQVVAHVLGEPKMPTRGASDLQLVHMVVEKYAKSQLVQVKLKDTGRVVNVSPETLKKEPGKYQRFTPDKKDGPSSGGGGHASQVKSIADKIDKIDAGGSKKELDKDMSSLIQSTEKLMSQLEKMKAKGGDHDAIDKAMDHLSDVHRQADKIVDAAGDGAKVDQLLADVQKEIMKAHKLLA